jgi:GTPase
LFKRSDAGERALLVHLKLRDPRQSADLAEFEELAISAGAVVVDVIINNINSFKAKYLVGKGKIEQLQASIANNNIELVIFNHELSPAQARNLEQALECRVLDRAGLILDIFAQRARTFEGKLQVELAQLQHLSTRLVRGWTHLERQKGGIGLRGPGETQLESDRRLIRQRIKHIVKRVDKVRSQRSQGRRARVRNQVPTISLVGYTNAGKSTLFNKITGSDVLVKDQLFATLDPTYRTVELPYLGKAILVDTVGFIRDLPHDLIKAFNATLEETKDANLLLHVIDCNDELWREHKVQVEAVLHEIGALNVPMLEVYNKIDLIDGLAPGSQQDHNGIVSRVNVSASREAGLSDLLLAMTERLCNDIVKGLLVLKPTQAQVRAKLYHYGAVDAEAIDGFGNFRLDITLLRQRWQTLCSDFAGLSDSLTKG